MNIFKNYASYYDLIYANKKYNQECQYVKSLIDLHHPQSKTILDLGCGTGTHADIFSNFGYQVTAVDLSHDMIEIGKKKYPHLAPNLFTCDMREINFNSNFDVITSLFHVICYQTTDSGVREVFQKAFNHLSNQGLFIFDFWYGPAVLNLELTPQSKQYENNDFLVNKKSHGIRQGNSHLVDVSFEMKVFDKNTKQSHQFTELHTVRFFFEEELSNMLKECGFKTIKHHEFLQLTPPSNQSWGSCIVAKKEN